MHTGDLWKGEEGVATIAGDGRDPRANTGRVSPRVSGIRASVKKFFFNPVLVDKAGEGIYFFFDTSNFFLGGGGSFLYLPGVSGNTRSHPWTLYAKKVAEKK